MILLLRRSRDLWGCDGPNSWFGSEHLQNSFEKLSFKIFPMFVLQWKHIFDTTHGYMQQIMFNFCLLPETHSGATGSTWRTSRGTPALNFSLRPESWRRSGWISLRWRCKYEGAANTTHRDSGVSGGQVYVRLYVLFVCLWLQLCCFKAQGAVDSFVRSVWSGFGRAQAHTADEQTTRELVTR